MINKGDIVVFNQTQRINLEDYIALSKGKFSKFMIVVDVISAELSARKIKEKACKVMSSTGEVNWVSEGRLIKIQSLNNI
jgi:predicted transcriptional regulator